MVARGASNGKVAMSPVDPSVYASPSNAVFVFPDKTRIARDEHSLALADAATFASGDGTYVDLATVVAGGELWTGVTGWL
jgi:hypothetical protein